MATVEQIISVLSQYDPSIPVYLEGCDCDEVASGHVLIRVERGVHYINPALLLAEQTTPPIVALLLTRQSG